MCRPYLLVTTSKASWKRSYECETNQCDHRTYKLRQCCNKQKTQTSYKERERDRDRDRDRETETERDRERVKDRQRETETETDRDRQRQRERESIYTYISNWIIEYIHIFIYNYIFYTVNLDLMLICIELPELIIYCKYA